MDHNVFEAAKKGHVGALEKHGERLETMLTATKNTILHIYIACSSKSKEEEIVKRILEKCPELLLKQNESGETALHVAARHRRAGIVNVLIKAAEDHKNDDPEQGRQLIKTLIRTTNNHKNTALHEAVRFNCLDVVKMLTKKDTEFSYSANDVGETPLYLAAERGYHKLFSEIFNNCSYLVHKGPNGRTALHAAVISNNGEMMTQLLERDPALAKAADEHGCTPLHLAAYFGRTSIVKKLLEKDRSAAYLPENKYGRTALHLAALKGHQDVMEALMKYCPDCCELVDNKSQNVLHYAFGNQQYKIVDFVLKDGWLSNILLNGNDENGNTPLHQLADSILHDYIPDRFVTDARLDAKAFNKKNLNAHDIILANQDNIRTALYQADLKTQLRKRGVSPSHRIIEKQDDGGNQETGNHVFDENTNKFEKLHKDLNKMPKTRVGSEDIGGTTKTAKETNMVVATLIATVTFAAGIAMPGGYTEQGFTAQSRNAAFKVFVITNTIAMAMSSCSVLVLLYSSLHAKPKYENQISHTFLMVVSLTMLSLILMVVAFIAGTYAVLGGGHSSGLAVAACVVGCLFFYVLAHPLLSTERTILEAPHFLLLNKAKNNIR